HLRAAGVSLIVDARGAGVPSVIHWGADLGHLDERSLAALAEASVPAVPPSSIDVPLTVSLVPTIGEGWTGRPALAVSRPEGSRGASQARALRLRRVGEAGSSPAQAVVYALADEEAGVRVEIEMELTDQGVLRSRAVVTNTGSDGLGVATVAIVLPVPERADDLLDFSGLWAHEGRPIRRPLDHGVHARESRHGRGGHDNPALLSAGVAGFGWETGEVWALHAAWSGDTDLWAERSALGRSVLGAGELLAPGEIVLAAGESYRSPWVIAIYSSEGMNGISDRVHPWVRSWSSVPRLPRPVVLNTWEAVYFRHSLEALTPLIDAAREVGIERFVLDDGWFHGRTDDRRALGDWSVDETAWPDGLEPLIRRVHEAGMQFGLWVEPEMISVDSDTARAHPEWILGREGDLEWRFQRVLDLTAQGAAAHVFDRIDELLRAHDIAYLKWDHNRDLLTAGAHQQTAAVYALIDRLRAAHPHVEIESCASGGARLDLGMLSRVDRVWPSDTNDPLERQRITASSGILIPPEYLGAHVGAERAHTTHRHADASFRFATALFGSAGVEWDLSRATPEERGTVAGWIAQHKRLRSLLHTGRVVRADTADPGQVVHGVVDRSRRQAVFSIAMVDSARGALAPPVRFPGLDPDARYAVRPLDLGAPVVTIADRPPPWYAAGGALLAGRLLVEVGLPMPLLAPQHALVLHLVAVGESSSD
ncbi:alpha-galactosidase, partial [Microbacterium sp. P02]|uniref:alpha-galactosidase n=1 Tax=Microbacterium sp. P02 TaxID=3366260 RepID=UPI003670C8C3